MSRDDKIIITFLAILIISLFTAPLLLKPKTDYYAIAITGDALKIPAEELVAYPLLEPDDANKFWPVFQVRLAVKLPFAKERIVLKSKPFIISENPNIEGDYGDRMVYYYEK